MPIEHIGLGVPDIAAAKSYHDEPMPLFGFEPCFGNGYRPEGLGRTGIYLYEATEVEGYSRHGVGLHTLPL